MSVILRQGTTIMTVLLRQCFVCEDDAVPDKKSTLMVRISFIIFDSNV